MEQRREPRFVADQPVKVTVLTDPPYFVDARVRNASGRGLGLVVPTPLSPGAAIRIELDDAMVLGEAIYCRTEDAGYYIGVELDQVLVGLAQLGRNLSAFASEFSPESRANGDKMRL